MKISSVWRKSLIAMAVASAMVLTGCEGEDGALGDAGAQGIQGPIGDTGGMGPPGTDGTVDPTKVTTSGFAFPADAIYVQPDAQEGDDITYELILALFEVPDGTTIVLPKGKFIVSETITISASKDLTLTGYGINETVLDFTNATGDDGIRFEGGLDIAIRDLGILEPQKNGIKIVSANGVHIAHTSVIWAGELASDNGAYGLYPLQSQNILIENNYAYGSADAGIYVGQSNNIIVRNNVAKNNVAGIEIENSTMADVYDNLAIGNAGGILAFDLPGLVQAYGGNIRIFSNEITANNSENVGGGAVSIVPPGTGILIFSVSDVEIYHNNFTDNETSSIEVASYFLADDDIANYPATRGATMTNGWSPLVKNIYIHDNEIKRSGANPRGSLIEDIVAGYTLMLGQTMPAILYGGIGESLSNVGALIPFNALLSPEAQAAGVDYDPYDNKDSICASKNIDANSLASSADFPEVNIGVVFGTSVNPAAPDLLSESLHGNSTLLACTLERLPPAVVTFRGKKYGCTGDDQAIAACSL